MVRILFSFQDCNEESCILSLDYEPDAFKRLVEKFVIDRNRMNSLRPPIILSDFYVWFVNNHFEVFSDTSARLDLYGKNETIYIEGSKIYSG